MDVKAIRLRLGLTQQEFALRVGCSVYAVSHWEQGDRLPRIWSYKLQLKALEQEAELIQGAANG